MPLIIILAECGLELIPKQIRSHPAVKNNLSQRIYSSQLLDNALHHLAMKEAKLKKLEKRGRPDITHACLLNALGSPLNMSGNLQLFLHTFHDKIFEFNPEIRISRNYNRFKGLMAKLLIDKYIKVNSTALISQYNGTIKDLITKFKDPELILLSNKGKLTKSYQEIFYKDILRNVIVIIGGFQKSTFSEKTLGITKNVLSISKYTLDAWIVISKIINFYELIHNVV
jgi:rRNA small subunit pseudouridine methyltransferase Nep1